MNIKTTNIFLCLQICAIAFLMILDYMLNADNVIFILIVSLIIIGLATSVCNVKHGSLASHSAS